MSSNVKAPEATPVVEEKKIEAVVTEHVKETFTGKKVTGVAPKRKLDSNNTTISDLKDDPLERHIKEYSSDPLDSSLHVQGYHKAIKPNLNGLFEIIKIALNRLDDAVGHMRRPTVRGEWYNPIRWAILREFYLTMEYYEAKLMRPRNLSQHNRLDMPIDVAYAIQHLRPVTDKDGPVCYVDSKYVMTRIIAFDPNFVLEDETALDEYQSILASLRTNRVTTLGKVNLDWTTSLLNTAVLEEGNTRAYVSGEKLSSTQMLFALMLDLFRVKETDNIVFIPILSQANAVMAPYLTTHKRGEFMNYRFQYKHRISLPLATQTKM